MDIHNSIMDIHDYMLEIMDMHNWIMDNHNWIMDIHNQLWIKFKFKFKIVLFLQYINIHTVALGVWNPWWVYLTRHIYNIL